MLCADRLKSDNMKRKIIISIVVAWVACMPLLGFWRWLWCIGLIISLSGIVISIMMMITSHSWIIEDKKHNGKRISRLEIKILKAGQYLMQNVWRM